MTTNTAHANCTHPVTKAARAACRKARAATPVDPYAVGTACRVILDDDRGDHSRGTIVDIPVYEESGRPRFTLRDDQRVVRTGPYAEFIVTLDKIIL